MDFTLKKYELLLESFIKADYEFQTVYQFVMQKGKRVAIFRHDVDKRPDFSLQIAKIEKKKGICSTYYFRNVKESFNIDIINEIASLGHEIGYHYENMDTANGNTVKAYDDFCKNLAHFREIQPINTICMHGSPLSKYDNRDLWKDYDYKLHNIVAEPYFDIDYTTTLYLTDTGRSWNSGKANIRDHNRNIRKEMLSDKFNFRTTTQIIEAIDNKMLPDHIMLNTHPQRWSDNFFVWTNEWMLQNLKNVVKRIVAAKK